MASLIFVHGAWHGGWCWEAVAGLLRAQGHTTAAPDLPGCGGLREYVDKTRQALDQVTLPAILVGHSQGGMVITAAAERFPEAISGLVYLAAFLPRPGQSIVEILRENKVRMPLPYLTVSTDRAYTTAKVEALEEYIYHDCPREALLRAQAALRPEPMALSTESVLTTPERFGRIPRAYIECLEDRAIPPALQRAMYTATPCSPVLSLPTGHAPFFADPPALAALLHALAGESPFPSTH